MNPKNWLATLEQRGLIQDTSDYEGLSKVPAGTPFYVGFDPTAVSLQLGNLVPLIVAGHLSKMGFVPYILFGGSTGAIGDPSGKDKERPTLLAREQINENIAKQSAQVKKLLAGLPNEPVFVNNFDWTENVSVLDFLRDTGKHFTVNYMIAKEVVKTRLSGDGISYTEFSYMLLQAFDFAHLYKEHKVRVQFGGSDQWGNITAGLELIRRKGLNAAHGFGDPYAFSLPLITNSDGKKFGKSEGGALWLNPEMTSPYKLHQFLLNTEDNSVIKYLKALTYLSLEEISELERSLAESPELRKAQLKLADELVTMIHGQEATAEANRGREVLFSGNFDGISEKQLLDIFSDIPSVTVSKESFHDMNVLDLLVAGQVSSSKGEAKRLISQGGAYINGVRIEDGNTQVKDSHLPFDSVVILRAGKKKYNLIKLVD